MRHLMKSDMPGALTKVLEAKPSKGISGPGAKPGRELFGRLLKTISLRADGMKIPTSAREHSPGRLKVPLLPALRTVNDAGATNVHPDASIDEVFGMDRVVTTANSRSITSRTTSEPKNITAIPESVPQQSITGSKMSAKGIELHDDAANSKPLSGSKPKPDSGNQKAISPQAGSAPVSKISLDPPQTLSVGIPVLDDSLTEEHRVTPTQANGHAISEKAIDHRARPSVTPLIAGKAPKAEDLNHQFERSKADTQPIPSNPGVPLAKPLTHPTEVMPTGTRLWDNGLNSKPLSGSKPKPDSGDHKAIPPQAGSAQVSKISLDPPPTLSVVLPDVDESSTQGLRATSPQTNGHIISEKAVDHQVFPSVTPLIAGKAPDSIQRPEQNKIDTKLLSSDSGPVLAKPLPHPTETMPARTQISMNGDPIVRIVHKNAPATQGTSDPKRQNQTTASINDANRSRSKDFKPVGSFSGETQQTIAKSPSPTQREVVASRTDSQPNIPDAKPDVIPKDLRSIPEPQTAKIVTQSEASNRTETKYSRDSTQVATVDFKVTNEEAPDPKRFEYIPKSEASTIPAKDIQLSVDSNAMLSETEKTTQPKQAATESVTSGIPEQQPHLSGKPVAMSVPVTEYSAEPGDEFGKIEIPKDAPKSIRSPATGKSAPNLSGIAPITPMLIPSGNDDVEMFDASNPAQKQVAEVIVSDNLNVKPNEPRQDKDKSIYQLKVVEKIDSDSKITFDANDRLVYPTLNRLVDFPRTIRFAPQFSPAHGSAPESNVIAPEIAEIITLDPIQKPLVSDLSEAPRPFALAHSNNNTMLRASYLSRLSGGTHQPEFGQSKIELPLQAVVPQAEIRHQQEYTFPKSYSDVLNKKIPDLAISKDNPVVSGHRQLVRGNHKPTPRERAMTREAQVDPAAVEETRPATERPALPIHAQTTKPVEASQQNIQQTTSQTPAQHHGQTNKPQPAFEIHDLASSLKNSVSGEVQRVELILKPESLGKASAIIERIGDLLKLNFKIERPEARHAVEAETAHLRETLAAAGYNNVSIEFSPPSTTRSDVDSHADSHSEQKNPSDGHKSYREEKPKEANLRSMLHLGYNSFEVTA